MIVIFTALHDDFLNGRRTRTLLLVNCAVCATQECLRAKKEVCVWYGVVWCGVRSRSLILPT